MSRDKLRKLIMGGIIAGLAVWLILPRLLGRAGPSEVRAAEAGVPVELKVVPIVPVLDPRPTERTEFSEAPWPTDPFLAIAAAIKGKPIGIGEAGSSPRGPVLNGIVSGGTPRALIDGKVVTIGDRIADGSVVTAIEADTVSLEGPQGESFLKLSQ